MLLKSVKPTFPYHAGWSYILLTSLEAVTASWNSIKWDSGSSSGIAKLTCGSGVEIPLWRPVGSSACRNGEREAELTSDFACLLFTVMSLVAWVYLV
jgi:hypothetical protein